MGYGILKLNNKDGTIRYGTYELDFYKLPINLTRRNQVDVLKFSVKLTVGSPHYS